MDQLIDTCALDVADRGPQVLEDVGQRVGITRERIRQIEEKVLERIRETLIVDDNDLPSENDFTIYG